MQVCIEYCELDATAAPGARWGHRGIDRLNAVRKQ